MFDSDDFDKFVEMDVLDRRVARVILFLLIVIVVFTFVTTAIQKNIIEFIPTLIGSLVGLGLFSMIAMVFLFMRGKTQSITTLNMFRVKLADPNLSSSDRDKINEFLLDKLKNQSFLAKLFK